MTGQEAVDKTATQEVLYNHKEELIYCGSDRGLEQGAQRGCGVSFSRAPKYTVMVMLCQEF